MCLKRMEVLLLGKSAKSGMRVVVKTQVIQALSVRTTNRGCVSKFTLWCYSLRQLVPIVLSTSLNPAFVLIECKDGIVSCRTRTRHRHDKEVSVSVSCFKCCRPCPCLEV
jgi:hypothetical protein